MFGLFKRINNAVLELVNPYTDTTSQPTHNVWSYIFDQITPLKKVLILSLISTMLAAAFEVWLIAYAGQLIDILSNSDPETIWQTQGSQLLTAAFLLIFLRPILQFARHCANSIGLDCNIAQLVRWRAYRHLSQQSIGWFQEDYSGRTSARMIESGNHAAKIIYEGINAISFGLIYMLGIVILMSNTDSRLAIPLFIWLTLYIALVVKVIPKMISAQRRFQATRAALTGRVVDCFSNFDTVKLFARTDVMTKDFQSDIEATRRALSVPQSLSVGLRTTVMLLEGIMVVSFLGYGIWLWSVDAASIGLIASALALTFRITALAEWVIDASWAIFLNVGNLGDSLKTLAQPLLIPPKKGAPELVVKSASIDIQNLKHQYGTGLGGLRGINLSIASGEKVGLVGASGAGKSTLVNLILRFFEAEQGNILIDKQNIREVEQDSLRAAIGIVSQHASLLNRSVKDNIALGQENKSLEDIISAAKQAHAHDFILTLKDQNGNTGYDAHVGERGIKLSGGQRQRIALARVILKDAPILILDEATSALDSKVEADIQAALKNIMKDKTVIAIAHRLSTIAQMDRILVFKDGLTVEEGSHDELLSQNGLYAEFWSHQSGDFLTTD
ncbi:ABC transporter ATP-binding protein/permease [Marinomonas sp. C2222]|uniref:ABC transporter ATP-binding protein/permease n=1 Tax=Marinomonas sargassi TaxID=2984494 RepID=A0ABT2YRZ2_9GAMM|nr:ABC transporter ATP-binding protein [Marinomonas sargassi]MCV2402419.1 ABC transporter ATP-binding protein/permease [Marinomonas sargassi]